MSKITVAKFGGTSMGDAECMLRSARIAMDHESKVVVVSATSGTTNQLIEIGHKASKQAWPEIEGLILKVISKHEKIAADLRIEKMDRDFLSELFNELESLAKGIHLLRDCSPRALDTLQSLGERMSSLLFTTAIRAELKRRVLSMSVKLLDARTVLRTDDQFGKAKPNIEKTSSLAKTHIGDLRLQNVVFVTQGFIGGTDEGMTTTLGRGGSDYSAALFAEAVNADVLQIWTDVPGVASTDPRLCPKAVPIQEISFREASEMATFGAKVLHPATLIPAIRKNIPVFVGSSFNDKEKGTWIYQDVKNQPLVRALALRKKQVLVTLTTPEMLHAHGFLLQVFKVFTDHRISVDSVTTSEISVALTLDDSTLLNRKLIQDLEQIAEVQVEEHLSMVSLIGNNINHTSGLSKQIFEQIPDVNVRMICLGASKHNFCFLVNEDHAEEVIKRLHRHFIEAVH